MNFYIEIGISASISHHILKLKGPDPYIRIYIERLIHQVRSVVKYMAAIIGARQ